MRKSLACITAACAVLAALADPNDPQITLVGSNQGFDRVVTVRYTLDEPAIVTFDVKTNGVSIGAENLKLAYGDVHRVVAATGQGETRTLFWPAHEAWPDHRFGENVVSVEVTAWATNSPPDYMVIKLVGEDKGARTFYTAPEQLPGVGGVTNDMYKTDYLVMRRIPAAGATFRMGAPADEPGRHGSETLHYVTLTNDFYMAVFELTVGQFKNIVQNFTDVASGLSAYSSSKLCVSTETPNCPVDCFGCDVFRGTGKLWPGDGHDVDAASPLAMFRIALGLRTLDLPTDAEWEFACRAGTMSGRYDGTEYVAANDAGAALLGWFGSSWSSRPQAVGLLKPNGYGLYDLYGNVFEWCLDRFTWYTASTGSTLLAPVGPANSDTGAERVVRGDRSNANGSGKNGRSGFRYNMEYAYVATDVWGYVCGYRLVCTF
ncbi:MAG: SUMF1/EgtB/PvdO family nonheme iron enzyme [Kiritimatiellae bacterium]|nr:SUMF1/EgtB/PvdO family nonheme iron enzyme [Kiritimatiellia bacterium]